MAASTLKPFNIGAHRIEVPIILAPMAGVSEAPFRVMALEMGAGLAPTELVSAKGLEYANARTEGYLEHDPRRERPFAVQLFGGEPESMARAAELAVGRGAEIIDLNMGCPVKKVTKTGAGSALLCDPGRAEAIIRSIRGRLGDRIPVTVKIRTGWDSASVNAPEMARCLEGAGAAAIAIHGRTRAQGYAGRADWSVIRRVRETVRIPVIANGDIFSVADADRVVAETGCAAIMIGRAALGNPWIFRQLSAAWRREAPPAEPTPEARAQTILAHLSAHLEHVGDEVRGIRKFRQHLIWYSRGRVGGPAFRDRAVRLDRLDATRDAVWSFFSRAGRSSVAEGPIYDERTALG
ncbi:MAG: tRNA dihydrouridine synthase DusB [Deltaproteobacteria bacterium]|nr:tRNA dihydrouridine synthase DusB [Deltaproteobacteria bacterium]